MSARSAALGIDQLIDGLSHPDGNQRNKALGELSSLGRAAVPALTAALGHADGKVRALAMTALAFIADPSSADDFAAHVGDADAVIRGHAAHGLARLRDPRALDALIATLNDAASFSAYPMTLSTAGLIALGRGALPRLGPLLSSPDEMTRIRAYFVLEQIVTAMGEDWPARWRALGSYAPSHPDTAARERAAAQWRDWIGALP
jgi:HEAT repeat protein